MTNKSLQGFSSRQFLKTKTRQSEFRLQIKQKNVTLQIVKNYDETKF